jgi:lipopolysaccharide transport system permease protein
MISDKEIKRAWRRSRKTMSLWNEVLISPFTDFFKYRELVFFQVRAEFKERHVQNALGPVWWFGQPLLMSLLFIFATSVLFKTTFTEHYQISIIMATLVWQWFSQSVNGAPNLLLGFQAELASTNLPIRPLVYSRLLVELMIFSFSLVIIFAAAIIDGVHFTLNVLYIPILIALQFIMNVAFVSNLGRIGLFYRDLSQILWLFVAIWFFVSPGAYPKIVIPQHFLWLYDLNPWATIFPAWRDSLIVGTQPDLVRIGIWFAIFFPLALIGLRKIVKSRAMYYKRL